MSKERKSGELWEEVNDGKARLLCIASAGTRTVGPLSRQAAMQLMRSPFTSAATSVANEPLRVERITFVALATF